MSDSQIASVSIKALLDWTEFDRNVEALAKRSMPKLHLKVTTDDRALTDLNKHIELKRTHVQDVQRFLNANPVTVRSDSRELTQTRNELQQFKRELADFKAQVGAKIKFESTHRIDTSAFEKALERAGDEVGKRIADRISKAHVGSRGGFSVGNIFSNILNAPFKLAAEAGKQIFIGTFQAVGDPLGKELGKGLRDGIERELSFSVGSMGLIGRKMGEAVAKEFGNVMAEELGLVGQIMRDLMGQADVVRSGADVRNRQRVKNQKRNDSGSEQLNREFDFFTSNSAEIRAKSTELDRKRSEIAKLDREIQSRVSRTADSLGLKDLQQQRKDIQAQRSQYAERLKQGDIPVDEQKMISLNLQRLNNQDRNAYARIEDVQKLARRRFQPELDRIAKIKDEFLAEENRFLRVVSAPDRVEFATKREVKRKPEVSLDKFPSTYVSVAKQVADLTGIKLRNNQLPALQIDPALPDHKQNYNPHTNAVTVSQEVYNQLQTGTASKRAIENLAHELVHAVQFKFGQITEVARASRKGQITPTPDEARLLGSRIEQSTGVGTPQEQAARRALEADAYTFAYRNKDRIFEQVVRRQNLSKLEESVGVGGGKASLEITRGAMDAFGKLQKYSSIAQVDVTHGLQEASDRIEKIRAQVLAGLQKLDNIDLLGTDEIEKIQKEILQSVQSGVQEIQSVTDDFKQRLINNPESLTKPFNPELSIKETEKAFTEKVKQQASAANQKRAVDPQATANLKSISDAIADKSSEQDALNRIKATSDYFVNKYAALKASIAKGGTQARKDVEDFVRAISTAQTEIDAIVSRLQSEGIDAGFASRLGGKLQGLKGQLSLKRNTAQRLASRQNLSQPDDPSSLYAFEDIQRLFDQARRAVTGKKQIDPDVLMFKTHYSQKAYDEAEIGIEHQFNKAYEQVNFSLENMGKSAETVTSRIRRIIKSNLDPNTTFGGFIESIKGVTTALAGFGAAGIAIAVLGNIARATTQAGLELDSLERRFKSVEGSQDAGKSRLEQLRQQSDRLGVSFTETAKAYAQFSSVTKDTPLEGAQTVQISEALSIAGGANGLSNERQRLVNTGFSQLLSKGKVSQEEIRGQIAESMPGFIQIAARAYGVTVPELNRMISGGMESDKFAVRVSQQMQAELQGASTSASKSPQAAFNRLGNANEELMGRAGQKFLPATALGAETAAAAVNLLANNIDKLLQLLATVATTAATFGFQGLIQSSGLLSTAITFVSTQVMSLISNLNKLMPVIGRFVAITAIIEGFKILQTTLSDSGGQFREFADASESSLKRYQKALADANETQADFVSKLPKRIQDVGGKSYLEDSIIGGFASKEFWRGIENNTKLRELYRKEGREYDSESFTGRMAQPLFGLIPNRAQKENKDAMKAMDDQLRGMDQTSQKIQDQLSGKNSELNRLIEINKQIEAVQLQRRAIAATTSDPGVKDPRLDELKTQEESLNKQRLDVLNPIAELQKKASEEVINAEKALEGLQGKLEDTSITQDQYNEKIGAYTDRLKTAKANQDKLNVSLRDSLSKLTSFERSIKAIAAESEGNRIAIDMQANRDNIAINSSETSGSLQRGQADLAKQELQREAARKKIEEDKAENRKKQAELRAMDADKIFAAYNISDSTKAPDIRRKIEETQDDRAKKAMGVLADIRDSEAKITQAEAQLSDQFTQTQRAIADSNRAVVDYYRTIERQTKDLKFELESMDLDTKLANTKNSIKTAMNGFQRTFVSEFGDAIVDVIETASGQIRSKTEALQQIQQRINANDDTIRQGNDLNRDSLVGGGAFATTQAPVGSKIAGSLKVTNRNDPDGSGYGFDYGVWDGGDDRGVGAPVVALAGGKVVEIREDNNKYGMGGKRGFGNQVYIRVMNPETGVESDVAYGHLNEINVKKDDIIGRGQRIGTQGETGSATAPHVTLNVFAKDASGGGQAEVALGRLLEQSIDRGTYANVGNVQTSQNASKNRTSSGSRISAVGGFDANRINTSVNILQQQGLTPLAAAYLTGSFMQESGGAGWEKADNGTHRGIMQWQKGVRDRGLPADFAGQVKYAVQEGMQDSPHHIATLKDPKASPEQVKKAIQGFTRWGPGEEKSRFVYGDEIFAQLGGSNAASSGGASVPGVDNSQAQALISEGQRQANENLQASTQAILKRSGALGRLAQTEARKKAEGSITAFDRGLQDQERKILEAGRNRIDTLAASEEQTPLTQLQTTLRGLQRDRDDKAKQYREDYKQINSTVTESEGIISAWDKLTPQEREQIPGKESVEPMIKKIRDSLPELRRQRDHFKQEINALNATFDQAQSKHVATFFKELSRSVEPLSLQVAEFRDQMGITSPLEKHRTEIDRITRSQVEFHRSYEKILPSLEGVLKLPEATEEQKKAAQTQIDLIRGLGKTYNEETEKAIAFKKAMFANDTLQASLGRDREFLDAQRSATTERTNELPLYYGTFGRYAQAESQADLDRADVRFNYQKRMADIQRLKADPNSGYAPEILNEMERLAGDEMQTKLRSISLNVKNFSNEIRDDLISGFTDGFTEVLMGTKTFGEALGGILKNMAQKLISMGLNSLFSNLFTNIFNGAQPAPMKSSSGGGAAGSIVGSVISKLIPGFAEGGIIGQGRSRHDDQLILAQRGEAVLTHRAVDLLGSNAIAALNDGMIPMFAKGGLVGGMMPSVMPRVNMRSTNQPRQVVHKIETTVINGQEFVTADQFRSAIDVVNRRSEQNAESAISGHVESIQSSPGYRSSLGMG